MWVYLGLLAAVFLGLHNLCKKHAVRDNAVYPVVLGTSLTGFLIFLPFFILSIFRPEYTKSINFYIPNLSLENHFFVLIKSVMMSCSWLLAYYALKYLPLTIVTPIRSSGPFFTFIGALLIYQERPNIYQWLGFFIIIFSLVN